MNINLSTVRIGVLCIVLLFSVSGCGFHLRGGGAESEITGTVFVTSAARSAIAEQVRRALQNRDVTLSDKREGATILLIINSGQTDSRTLSIGLNSSLRDIELSYTVNFTAWRAGNAPPPAEQLRIIREYNFDPDDVLRSADEQDLLYREMRRELVRRLLNRLSLLNKEKI